MGLKHLLMGIILVGLLSACLPSGLDSADPAIVATTVASTLEATTKSSTFGVTPDTVYYGSGCLKGEPTKLILYFFKPETWVSPPTLSGGAIIGLDFVANYEFDNDAMTAGYADPEKYVFSAEEAAGGYRYVVLDLAGKTFTGEEGWLKLYMTMIATRMSGDLSMITTWQETVFGAGPLFVRAMPCRATPLDLLYTGGGPTPDSRYSGEISVSPTTVSLPPCKPRDILVEFKPDSGSELLAGGTVEHWAVLSFSSPSSPTPSYEVHWRLAWDGGSDGKLSVSIPTSFDWSGIKESGTLNIRVEVHKAGDFYGEPLFTTDYSGGVALNLCPKDLKIVCPANQTVLTVDPYASKLGDPLPLPKVGGSCSPFNVICTPPISGYFELGKKMVSCDANDECGNTAWCTFDVTVQKAKPVEVVCAENVSVAASSSAGAVARYGPPNAYNGCSELAVSCNPPPGTTFPVGITSVTCTARDTCGQSAACTLKVTVFRPPTQEPPHAEPPPQPAPFDCGQAQDEGTCNQYGNTCQWVYDPQQVGSCVSR
jgi:hypothetical protein